ncbi:hypothetical protein [Gorillibacterium sp. sgz5001074]|uniref:hypothetical protein n=1 Tax=Gorillibacterium sp. sgz5001074 TaxID=3446695 RepID=UPI003F674248
MENVQPVNPVQPSDNKDDLAFAIVRSILDDIQGRYGLDQMILGGTDRTEQEVIIAMFEKWRHLVSHELHLRGLITEKYSAMETNKLKKLSLNELLELREKYLSHDPASLLE